MWDWLSFANNFVVSSLKKNIVKIMEIQNYNCKKCGLTVSSICSKCDRVVDVKVLDNGCIVQKTKCNDCANVPVIKDVCSQS